MKIYTKILLTIGITIFALGFLGSYTNAHTGEPTQTTVRAEVIKILSRDVQESPGLGIKTEYQTIQVKILEGKDEGKIIIVKEDFEKLKEGDKFFLNILETPEGEKIYGVYEFDRRGILLFFTGLFFLAVILLGKWKGVRSLLGLGVTFLVIIYILVPQILAGRNPVLLSLFISLAVLAFTIYFTYGFNKKSHAAFIGAVASIVFTFFLAFIAVDMGHLSGHTDDAVTFLNIKTEGVLNFSSLLLGAMIIGILGVLDDIAITQAATVQELSSAASHLSRKEIFTRALNVGKEHVSALVNTIALAYTGASLPLILLFMHSESSIDMIINRDIFATEILRIIVGSIGVILTVPITTGLAILFLTKQNSNKSQQNLFNRKT